MINQIQTTALTVLSGGVLILASLVSGNVAEAAPGYSTFSQSQSQLDASRINAAKGKGRAAHQSIQSGGTASPRADGYGSMNTAEKEAYKSGFRGEYPRSNPRRPS